MKKHIVCGILLILSLVMMICVTVPVSAAGDGTTVVKDQKDVYLHISDKNSSYIYLSAEAPAEWSGNLLASFHSKTTGKDYEAEMNFIPEEWTSGIWLPFGTYTVQFSIAEDDGMCLVALKDSDLETFKVEKGKDLHITALVTENPNYEAAVPTRAPDYQPPLSDDAYQDIPVIPANPSEESSETSIPETMPAAETQSQEITVEPINAGHHILWGIVLSVSLVTISGVTVYICRKKSESKK